MKKKKYIKHNFKDNFWESTKKYAPLVQIIIAVMAVFGFIVTFSFSRYTLTH